MNKKICIFILLNLIPFAFYSLTIYRPANSSIFNDIPSYIKIEDENGNDVTYTAATYYYSYIDKPKILYKYKKSLFITGAMDMHVYLKKGKYRISFYTPKEKQFDPYKTDKDWNSNYFYYNTENPLNVLFLSPTANENGFYNGGWYLDYKAPKYFKFTIPKMEYKQNSD